MDVCTDGQSTRQVNASRINPTIETDPSITVVHNSTRFHENCFKIFPVLLTQQHHGEDMTASDKLHYSKC